MAELRMPSLGADMESGTLLEWKIAPGDRVRRGDIVAVVDTDKAAVEIEAFAEGVVESILVEPGARVPVGTPLATLRGAGEAPAAPAARPAPADRTRASPAAAKLARERGIDLARVRGTGPEGAIRIEDVERSGAPAPPALAPPGTLPEAAEDDAARRMRRAIAAAMARSKREIPHYYLRTAVSLERATAWLAERNAALPVTERLLPAALLVKAVALAAREVPEVNGFFENGAFRPAAAVHVGVATLLRRGGLVAPALHDADRLTLAELMAALRELVTRAREGRLKSSELADATITVTSLGERGADEVLGVIHPPQVAMVGFGAIRERPWVQDGRVAAVPIVQATLAADHRVSDGHRGALFLAALDRRLQKPEAL
jgi:pyruvate dehydrogenase E2 component (dihydrolipoamide acetyltransferase)